LIAADYTCQRCERAMALEAQQTPTLMRDIVYSAALHVHHRTYARFGHERIEDLEVLCESCHNAEHASRAIKPRFMRAG
jgi:5-methylcytosine-specific restriction endonuclease McrA